MNQEQAVADMLAEIEKSFEVMAAKHGKNAVKIAAEQANIVTMIGILHGRIPEDVLSQLMSIFTRLVSMSCDFSHIQASLVCKLADEILGYKKTLTDELAEKLSNPPSTKENPNG